jgi:hypothetical protein
MVVTGDTNRNGGNVSRALPATRSFMHDVVRIHSFGAQGSTMERELRVGPIA